MSKLNDIYPPPKSDVMEKKDYDVNRDLRIDTAEKLANSDRTIQYTAEDIKKHISDRSIHFVIDDEGTPALDKAYSSHKINDLLLGYAKVNHRHYGIDIDLDTSQFGNLINQDDNTVQKALNRLDKAAEIDEKLKCGVLKIQT